MSRPVDRQAQEARLSQAVWEVLARHGIERLTIRAVAEAAGCTTGLVMHRFPHRRALLLHARQLLHERTRARVERLEAEAATPRAALRVVLTQGLALTDEMVAESTVWTGFLAAAVGDPELLALHRSNHEAWRRRVTRLVAAATPEWPEQRVTTVALSLIALAEGTAALASADPETYSPAVQEAMLDHMLAGLGLAE